MKVIFEHQDLDTLKSLMGLWVQVYEPSLAGIRVTKEPEGFKGVISYPQTKPGETS